MSKPMKYRTSFVTSPSSSSKRPRLTRSETIEIACKQHAVQTIHHALTTSATVTRVNTEVNSVLSYNSPTAAHNYKTVSANMLSLK